jgi:hypothetical protein
VKVRILETVPSRSKPDRGRVKLAFELHDDQEGILAEWISHGIFGKRPVAE